MHSLRLRNRFQEETALILDERLYAILEFLTSELPQLAEPQFLQRMRDEMRPKMTIEGGIAHVPIQGMLAYSPDVHEMLYNGVEDSRQVLKMVNDAKTSSEVQGVIYHVDSPGGFSVGGMEIADAVAECTKCKPTVAHIGGTGASLGYLIASQAGEVIANRSSRVGSIGAMIVHTDISGMLASRGVKVEVITNKEGIHKGKGVMGTPLDDAHRTSMKAAAQDSFDEFRSMVLAARPKVPDTAMTGQVFTGKQAKANGLVDRVGDQSFALGVLKQKIKPKST